MSDRSGICICINDRLVDFVWYDGCWGRELFVEFCDLVNRLDGCKDYRNVRKALGRDPEEPWNEAEKFEGLGVTDSNMCIDLTRRYFYAEPYSWGKSRARDVALKRTVSLLSVLNRGNVFPEGWQKVPFGELAKIEGWLSDADNWHRVGGGYERWDDEPEYTLEEREVIEAAQIDTKARKSAFRVIGGRKAQ